MNKDNKHTPTRYSVEVGPNKYGGDITEEERKVHYVLIIPTIPDDKLLRLLNSHDTLVGALWGFLNDTDGVLLAENTEYAITLLNELGEIE